MHLYKSKVYMYAIEYLYQVYAHACVHVRVAVCVVCVCVLICMYACVRLNVRIHVSAHACTYERKCAYVRLRAYVCMVSIRLLERWFIVSPVFTVSSAALLNFSATMFTARHL